MDQYEHVYNTAYDHAYNGDDSIAGDAVRHRAGLSAVVEAARRDVLSGWGLA